MVVSVLLKIKFGHTQTSLPKIGIYIAVKTACINPCLLLSTLLVLYNPSLFFWVILKYFERHSERHGVARKKSTKRLKHTANPFRRNLQIIGVC